MKQKPTRGIVIMLIAFMAAAMLLIACPTETYTVSYDGNGADSGIPPVDDALYAAGSEVTVLGNTGGLEKPGFYFDGWNTASDGSGERYTAGETFKIGAETVTLYAIWAETEVTGVSINKSIATITVGATEQLSASVEPGDAHNQSLTWTSSEKDIVYVDDDGLATGIAGGNATITVTTIDGGYTAECAVTVEWVPTTGAVSAFQKIAESAGGFTETLDDYDLFGHDVAAPGDLNEDGVPDLVVGVYGDDDGGSNRGAVYVFFMNSNGSAGSYQKICETEGYFNGTLADDDRFGWSVASLGDLDEDGVKDLAVGAAFDDGGGSVNGAVWILFMNRSGTVESYQKINASIGGFTGSLDSWDEFGSALVSPGDLNGDGTADLVVGASQDDDGNSNAGAVYVLFLKSDGTVAAHQKISSGTGGFTETLGLNANFGDGIASPGDLNSDGIPDLAVSAYRDDDGGTERGSVWVLFMNSDGTVKSQQKISSTQGNFTGTLEDGDGFGESVSSPGDLDGDGMYDLIVGAGDDDDGGADSNRGAVWILFLNSDGTVSSYQKISDTAGSFSGSLEDGAFFGSAVICPGDISGDGVADLAVGAVGEDGGGTNRGAIWVLFLDEEE